MTLVLVTDRAQRVAREDALALQLCNRFIEQLRLVEPRDETASTLTQLNLVESNSEPASATYYFSHIPPTAGTCVRAFFELGTNSPNVHRFEGFAKIAPDPPSDNPAVLTQLESSSAAEGGDSRELA